jgi:hypothetical protein
MVPRYGLDRGETNGGCQPASIYDRNPKTKGIRMKKNERPSRDFERIDEGVLKQRALG